MRIHYNFKNPKNPEYSIFLPTWDPHFDAARADRARWGALVVLTNSLQEFPWLWRFLKWPHKYKIGLFTGSLVGAEFVLLLEVNKSPFKKRSWIRFWWWKCSKLLEIFAWMVKSIAIKVVQRSGANREEKSLHYTAEVAQFLDLNKPRSNKYGRKNCHVWLSCAWLHSGTKR